MVTKRQDIQGLRAVGVLLVAIFHIFEWGVSGGVDVFLTVSGFFLWFTAVKLVELDKDYLDHYRGFFTRTVPQTLLVILVALAVSFILVSPAEWSSILRDAAFSAVFLQNYRLAILDHDYLARSENLSLFQHYWAVSVIAQVYFIFPALTLGASLISKYAKFRKKVALALIITFVSILSFGWFVYLSFNFPRLMHYETLARIWQFGAGAIVAALISQLKIKLASEVLVDAMSWLGLLAVLLCGFLIGDLFPGFASIWPTFGALLLLIFSSDTVLNKRNASFLLSQKLLVWFGSISFGIYLWHWPIYAIYFRYSPEQTPLSAGIIIITTTALTIMGILLISHLRSIFGLVEPSLLGQPLQCIFNGLCKPQSYVSSQADSMQH
jgi:peptidoglycan/LPS O-acetylase OafA/YrhL